VNAEITKFGHDFDMFLKTKTPPFYIRIQDSCPGIDFPGSWFTAKFLDKMYRVRQTLITCVKNCKCDQTLISEGQCVLKWVEPALGNEKTQRGRLKDSYSGVGFS
jgi:hypothetical protein